MKRLHHWTLSWRVNWQDVWVGVYWKGYCNAIDFYVCLLPCLPVNIYVQWHHCLDHRDNVLTLLAYRPMTPSALREGLNAGCRHWWQRVGVRRFNWLMASLENKGLVVQKDQELYVGGNFITRRVYDRAVTLPK